MSVLFTQIFIFGVSFGVIHSVMIGKHIQVTPRCGSQLISIEVNFNASQLPGGKFTDWIIVGVSGRPECRLRGNGESKYIIEIAVFNDPCMTQIPAHNVFQNKIRIGKNPVVILEEDQSITVKCIYGFPSVETMALPVIKSNFNIDSFAQSSAHPSPEDITLPSPEFAPANSIKNEFDKSQIPNENAIRGGISNFEGFGAKNVSETFNFPATQQQNLDNFLKTEAPSENLDNEGTSKITDTFFQLANKDQITGNGRKYLFNDSQSFK
uniref:ZP domain-containing protein n=1 Tax=Caenorhabditis japonica TaxID=281687 RepID=A0A8R1IDR5_CAEJA